MIHCLLKLYQPAHRHKEESDWEEILTSEIEYLEKLSLSEVRVRTLNKTLSANSSNTCDPSSTKPSAPNVRLEKLQLPTFDGTVLKFTHFWDSFVSRIHTNTSLSAIDKLEYLRSRLVGSAFKSIEGLEFSATGYAEAIEIIKRRYGRKIPRVNAHLSALFSLPNLADTMDVVALRGLCDSMNVHIRSLKCVGINVQNNSEVLGPILLSRLPLKLRVLWQEHVRSTNSVLDGANSVKDGSVGDDPGSINVVELLEFFVQQVEDLEGGLDAIGLELARGATGSETV